MSKFVIGASRSSSSVFGAAYSLLKDKRGKVCYFSSLAAAQEEAAKLNKGLTSSNVHYTACEKET